MRFIDEKIENYCMQVSWRPSAVCQEIADYTHKNIAQAQMLIGPMEASILGFLIRSISAQRILEIGCFTGYSALSMAENLSEGAELVTLDVNSETTKIAQGFWDKSSDGKKIKPIVGPALESIQKLKGPFDFVFIDADKENYLNYLKAVSPLLSKKALIVADNCLWSGRILDSEDQSASTQAIRAFNKFVSSQKEFFVSLLPVRDGMFLIQVRK